MGASDSKEAEPPPAPPPDKKGAAVARVRAFVIGSAATLSIVLYVCVAVVKTMLTKVLLETSSTPVGFSSVSAAATCVALIPVFLVDRSAWALPKREYLPGFLLVCLLVAFDLGFTNIAISLLSLTLQQCLIATNPAFTVTIESFYKRALAHPAIYAIIAVLCCGPVVMATAGKPEAINGVGVIMQLLGVVCSACKGVFLHALLSTVKKDLGGVGVLFWIDAIILVVLVPWSMANGELVALLHEPKNAADWFNLLFTAVLGGVRFYSQVLVLKFHPASSLAVANLAFQAINIYLSLAFFGWPKNVLAAPHPDQSKVQVIAGTVVTLSAAAVFSYFKVSKVLEKNAKCASVHESFKGCCGCCKREAKKQDPPLLGP